MKSVSILFFLGIMFFSAAYSKGYNFFCNQKYYNREGTPYSATELIFYDNGTFSLKAGFEFIGIWNKKGTQILLSDFQNITPDEAFMQGPRFFTAGQTVSAQVCRNGNILINWGLKRKSRMCREWICFCEKHHIRSFCKYKAIMYVHKNSQESKD